MIVNTCEGPSQLIPLNEYDGTTVIVAVTGTLLVFTAVNEAMLPVPVDASPINGLLFVQL